MRLVFRATLLALTVACAVSAARAQTTGQPLANSITGMVFDRARNPVPQLRVELLDEVNSIIGSARTDAIGRFRFNGLSQGTFQVRVITSGTAFVEQVVRVQLSFARRTSGAQHEQIDIYLTTRDEEKGVSPANAGTTFAQDVPENAKKAFDRGVILLEKDKDTVGGINALVEAVEIFPDYYMALERLGAEFVKLPDYEKAQLALTNALRVNPTGNLSLYALGVTEYNLKQYDGAVEHLKSAIVAAPGSVNTPLAHFYLGLTFLKVKRTGEAETQFKRAYELGGKRVPADVHMHLAQIYSKSDRNKEAADELELFLKETPNARDADSIKNLIKQLRAKSK